MYKLFPNFVLRTPLLSFENLENILNNKESLLCKLKEKNVQEAIYLASPQVFYELKKMLNNELKDSVEEDKLICSLVKYICRMSTRCTPFGLFAGCSVGILGNETKIELSQQIEYKIRLDMNFLCSLAQVLSQKKTVQSKIKYHFNSSIYTLGNKYRYIQYKFLRAHMRYNISSVEKTEYLDQVLLIDKDNMSVNELAGSLVSPNISYEEAEDFIKQLISNQLLIGDLEPHVCGGDYFTKINNILRLINIKNDIDIKTIFQINNLLNLSCNLINMELYHSIIKLIDSINIPYEESNLFQIDMNKIFIKDKKSIGNNVISELQSTISFLNKITSSEGRGSLEQFKKTFTERYEDREIPLLLALDTEIGIGYPINSKPNDSTPLLENFFTPQRISYNSLVNMTKLQSVLLTKYTELKTNGQSEIILTDEDFVGLKENWDNLPLTFYALFEIVKTEKNNILLKINTISGNSGANLISRYAYCNEDIYNLTTEITAKEDELANGSIIAEIAYLPDSRIGNIISRPNIRKYEIVYLSNTDIDQEYQIPLSDLMISVKKDKIYIRSKKLNKLIIPRLTTAHNYENNPIPAYSFLCDMQYYTTDRSRLYFDWGFLTQVINYRPRVKYKNSILSLASWTISINNIKLLFLTKNNAELINGFKDWREKINMPRYVMLLDGDNKLFVDWNSKMSILALFSSIKQKQSVIFEEFLFDSQNALVKCNDETYTNECIVIFYKDIAK